MTYRSEMYSVIVNMLPFTKYLDETVQLLDAGFEYVIDYRDRKIFRKRK